MKIETRVSLFFDRDGLRIEIHDETSGITFFQGTVDGPGTLAILSRQGDVKGEGQVYNLENVGKRCELENFVMPIPSWLVGRFGMVPEDKRPELARLFAETLNTEHTGPPWFVSPYFGSKDSFTEVDGVPFAKCTAYRFHEIDTVTEASE